MSLASETILIADPLSINYSLQFGTIKQPTGSATEIRLGAQHSPRARPPQPVFKKQGQRQVFWLKI